MSSIRPRWSSLAVLGLALLSCVTATDIGRLVAPAPYHVADLPVPAGVTIPAECDALLDRIRLWQTDQWARLCGGPVDCCLLYRQMSNPTRLDPVATMSPVYPGVTACTWHETGHALIYCASGHHTFDYTHDDPDWLWLWSVVRYGPQPPSGGWKAGARRMTEHIVAPDGTVYRQDG